MNNIQQIIALIARETLTRKSFHESETKAFHEVMDDISAEIEVIIRGIKKEDTIKNDPEIPQEIKDRYVKKAEYQERFEEVMMKQKLT